MKENLENIPEDVIWGKETPAAKKVNDLARVGKRMMTNAEWNAKGKQKALEELAKDGGAFDGIITTGIDFSKGIAPPDKLVPAPLGITRILFSKHNFNIRDTSFSFFGATTRKGSFLSIEPSYSYVKRSSFLYRT